MEIEEIGVLKKFEPMPTEVALYISAVYYESPGSWMGGPSSYDKGYVITALQSYTGVTKARIYELRLPVNAMPAA